MIEKHFTLDRNDAGPDHAASLLPHELATMVQGIRDIGRALGRAHKGVTASELPQRELARRSLVLAKAIAAGEIWSEAHLVAKRPATGMNPMRVWEMLGTPADRDYAQGELLEEPEPLERVA